MVRRAAPTRNPGVFFFASFRLDEQTKGSRTAVRNRGFDKLVSAEKRLARTARFLDELYGRILAWGFALLRE